jgi:prephenate dehydratase
MLPSLPPDAPAAPPRVGYLGPEGTFSEEALLSSAREGAVTPQPLGSIFETVQALREQEVSWAVVPVENSLDGSITVTLDLLAEEASGIRIVGESLLRVSHSLIASERIGLDGIRTVYTHPQVPGQCARFLRGELANAQILPAASTAEAVRMVVAAGRTDQAALGTLLAAQIYGGAVLREGVEDRDDNETRFLWIARASDAGQEPPLRWAPGALWKTSVVFWGSKAGSPGWLVRCLDEFARREINLTKIESRPRRQRLGSYMFFADLLGGEGELPVAEAIAGMREICEGVGVLGSYRAAAAPAFPAP